MEGDRQMSDLVPVIAYQHPHYSSQAELRCGGSYDFGRRGCSRLLIRLYRPTVADLGLYCARCKVHHRVHVDFAVGVPKATPVASLSKAG